MFYLQESEIEKGIYTNRVSVSQAMDCDDSIKWTDVIEEELRIKVKSRISLNYLKDIKIWV